MRHILFNLKTLLIGSAFLFCSKLPAQVRAQSPDQTPKPAPQQETEAPDPQAILQKVIAAAGGQKAFEELKNFKIKTESIIYQPRTKIKLTVTETTELPDKTKQVMELPAGKRIQVLNGVAGWKQLAGKVEALTSAEKREIRRGLRKNTFSILKYSGSPKFKLQFIGRETSGDKTYFVLQIKDVTGDFVNLYIDATSYTIDRKSYRGASEVGLATLVESYSDYRRVGGFLIPFHTEVRANGKKFIDSTVLEAQFNLFLKPDFFNIN